MEVFALGSVPGGPEHAATSISNSMTKVIRLARAASPSDPDGRSRARAEGHAESPGRERGYRYSLCLTAMMCGEYIE